MNFIAMDVILCPEEQESMGRPSITYIPRCSGSSGAQVAGGIPSHHHRGRKDDACIIVEISESRCRANNVKDTS